MTCLQWEIVPITVTSCIVVTIPQLPTLIMLVNSFALAFFVTAVVLVRVVDFLFFYFFFVKKVTLVFELFRKGISACIFSSFFSSYISLVLFLFFFFSKIFLFLFFFDPKQRINRRSHVTLYWVIYY